MMVRREASVTSALISYLWSESPNTSLAIAVSIVTSAVPSSPIGTSFSATTSGGSGGAQCQGGSGGKQPHRAKPGYQFDSGANHQ